MASLIIEDECSICESLLKTNEEIVKTDCDHRFHRSCAQQRLDEKNKTDCRTCGKPKAIADALQHQQTTVNTMQSNLKQTQLTTKDARENSSNVTIIETETNDENNWKCENCSMQNPVSTKRCESCGEQKNPLLPITDRMYIPPLQNNDNYSSESDEEKEVYHDNHYETDENDFILKNDSSSNSNSGVGSLTTFYEAETSVPRAATTVSTSALSSRISSQITTTQPTLSLSKMFVYISDLPIGVDDKHQLETQIRSRLRKIYHIGSVDVQCHIKLGVGLIYVENEKIKDRLINDIKKIVLDPNDEKSVISFVPELELISYVVIKMSEEKKDFIFPTLAEVNRRCMEIYNCEKSWICEKLNTQFPNIYKIVFTSLDILLKNIDKQDVVINGQIARIYYCADCSFFEDLPRSVNENKLRRTIEHDIQQSNISSSDIWIQINKQTNNACVIVIGKARLWSTKSYLCIDDRTLSKKNNLTCLLRIFPVPQSYRIDKITNYSAFIGKVANCKQYGDSLTLELNDKTVFDEYVTRGLLRIDDKSCFRVEPYHKSNNPEACEIDEYTWYDTEMQQIKPDIMQYVVKPEHEIFQYKWNSNIWLKQFQNLTDQNQNRQKVRDQRGTPTDKTRHLLRVTVMLNTLATVRKRSYVINDHEVKLPIDNRLKTIVYDHHSKLIKGGKLSITKTPYQQTRIEVIKDDCLIVYERLVNNGCNPVLLNMANATSPGGGYRRGDGAQEENLFRRSDYFRSLDVELDQWLSQRSERFHCSSNCQLDLLHNNNDMYPMNEYGAIYTSGLTVFRQSEDEGYAYMKKPLSDVCSIAIAAYRDPHLDGNKLSSKYAVGTRKKIENIFAIAFHHKHDSLVLSAFGCGAFKNPPDHIAQLFCSVIEQYAGFFKLITFAIIDDHNSGHNLNPEGNFQPFKVKLDGMVVSPVFPKNRANTMFGPYRILSDGLSMSDVCIFDKTLCKFGAQCNDIYNRKHADEFIHPARCSYEANDDNCNLMKDFVHLNSFIHRKRCQYGGECRQIDDKKHSHEYEHPLYCPSGCDCHDMNDEHLKKYRHLPLCEDGHQCLPYQKHSKPHSTSFRHCMLDCSYGNNCANFHDKEHQDNYKHSFPPPCPFTPFRCKFYVELTKTKDHQRLPVETQQHCLKYAHVCRFGRQCADKTPLHLEKSIHIARNICPDGDKCKQLINEDHLNSFTHPHIPDIRKLCEYADECYNRQKTDHVVKFRHAAKFEHDGILSYFNLNQNIDFVQNQKDIIHRVTTYIKNQKWKPLSSGNIPHEIMYWLRTVQPVHRCNPVIFESILLHGHVMSRQYMRDLINPTFVANSVLQHSRIRRISALQTPKIRDRAKEFVTTLVKYEFGKGGLLTPKIAAGAIGGLHSPPTTFDYSPSYKKDIEDQKAYLYSVMEKNDLEAIYNKTIEIADASINLHKNPSGIGYDQDKELGTDKSVFSILGPNLGHYYGDVIIVFKRAVLHHPDANFSMQAATTFTSGSAFKMRPWLSSDPGSTSERVKLYHRSKLSSSIPGYDYATALELIALTSNHSKLKSMDIDLNTIFDRWIKVDSHTNIEVHLPQLIPLSYIDHIYIPKNLHEALHNASKKAINANFKHRYTIVEFDGEADQPRGPHGPTPSSKSRAEYQNFVTNELLKRYHEHIKYSSSKLIIGAAVTIAPIEFTDHYLLPLTISQAYDQYRFAKKHSPPDSITYIYWQVTNGDMMLILSNQQIKYGEKYSKLQCLTCYIAPKSILTGSSYHEHFSYIDNNPPFKHHISRNEGKFAAKSNRFHIGCNTDDFMTFCLEIQRSTGTVTLKHAGPNSIYNHETISYTFSKSELDLTKLNFVHVSSGSQIVSVRNLIICFEKQADLHPSFDKNFKSISSASRIDSPQDKQSHDGSNKEKKNSKSKENDNNDSDNGDEKKSTGIVGQVKRFFFGDDNSKLTPCRDNVNCLLYTSTRFAKEHNAKYSHPCPFSELCRNKEAHLTHESHQVSMCRYDKNCDQLINPFHRAAYRHTDLPDYLLPCRYQKTCYDHTKEHRMKYSHGEQVYRKEISNEKKGRSDSPSWKHDNTDQRPYCKWGSQCRHIGDCKHREEYSHNTKDQNKGNLKREDDQNRLPCKYGASCYNTSSDHRANYSHPSYDEKNNNKSDLRTPCRYGMKCPLMNDVGHKAQYSHR